MAGKYSNKNWIDIEDGSAYRDPAKYNELVELVRDNILKDLRPSFKSLYNTTGETAAAYDLWHKTGFDLKKGKDDKSIISASIRDDEGQLKDAGELVEMAKNAQDFMRSQVHTKRGLHKGAEATREGVGHGVIAKDVTDLQLDGAYRYFQEFGQMFGSPGSLEILEGISRYVRDNAGITFDEMWNALREDIAAERGVAQGKYIIWDYEGNR